MYDPYLNDIVDWCNAGVPIKEMLKRIGEGYTAQGLYQFIKTKGLRYSKEAVYSMRNRCDDCEYCKEYINTNNTTGRLCTKSWKSIQPLVKYRPEWCEKEKGHEDQQNIDEAGRRSFTERYTQRAASL